MNPEEGKKQTKKVDRNQPKMPVSVYFRYARSLRFQGSAAAFASPPSAVSASRPLKCDLMKKYGWKDSFQVLSSETLFQAHIILKIIFFFGVDLGRDLI